MWHLDSSEAHVLYGVAFLVCVVAFVMQLRIDGWRNSLVSWQLWIIVAIGFDQYVWWRQ